MDKSIESVTSNLVNIEYLIRSSKKFNIPRYQRLFVWEDEQVETLLQDLYTAFESEKELYYVGGILVVEQKNSSLIYDLIDGQQRFTTLWLLCLELGGVVSGFTLVGSELRLRFSIRNEAKLYFENALNKNGSSFSEISKDNSSLQKIDNARGKIISFINQKLNQDYKKERFAEFILNAVKLIITEVPVNTDLNKLFEVTNNRGQQLQHHEILKAVILNKFDNKQERSRYSKIWNACAEMDNYIERNIQHEVGINLSVAFDPSTNHIRLDTIIARLKDKRSRVLKPITLNNILAGRKIEDEDNDTDIEYDDLSPEPIDDEAEPIRSVLSFPQLLLHTLRIFLYESGKKDINRINEKELLLTFNQYFKVSTEKEARSFIDLLWEVRVCFDLFIIKWVKNDANEEIHLIKKLEKYNQYRKWTYYFRRRKAETNDGFALLQSMLYHSQQITTHYWLTPLLYKALKMRNRNLLYEYLKKLDNVLFCSEKIDTLSERTWNALGKDLSASSDNYNLGIIKEDLGVSFPHYWFYKLEYVLWYSLKDKKDKRWESFKMTAKNSVEHVSPQTPEFKRDIVSDKMLGKFGNLALVSRKVNSQYSNKPYREKRERFMYDNSAKLDSLKLSLIYENPIWNDELCQNHENEMIEYLSQYLNHN